jgi:penicillin-binding protein 2
MPFDNPKFAISVVIEHGGSGASTAAPIASQIFKYIYNNKI